MSPWYSLDCSSTSIFTRNAMFDGTVQGPTHLMSQMGPAKGPYLVQKVGSQHILILSSNNSVKVDWDAE